MCVYIRQLLMLNGYEKDKEEVKRGNAANMHVHTEYSNTDSRNVIRSAIVNILKSISPQFIFDTYHIYLAPIKL